MIRLVKLSVPPYDEMVGEEINNTDPFAKKKRMLMIFNIVAIVLQLLSFIALTTISLLRVDDARKASLWVDEDRGGSNRQLGSYMIFTTLLPFPFLTAFFHLLAVFNVDDYYNNVLIRGVNRLRWIEYSITNGLMTFSLCVIAGAGDVVLITVNLLANVVMQYFGYLHESFNHEKTPVKRTLQFLIFGFVPWLQIWITILTAYGINYNTATTADGFSIIGSFILSLSFVVPLIWRYTVMSWVANNYYMELMYIVLSFTAKAWLDWSYVGGTL